VFERFFFFFVLNYFGAKNKKREKSLKNVGRIVTISSTLTPRTNPITFFETVSYSAARYFHPSLIFASGKYSGDPT